MNLLLVFFNDQRRYVLEDYWERKAKRCDNKRRRGNVNSIYGRRGFIWNTVGTRKWWQVTKTNHFLHTEEFVTMKWCTKWNQFEFVQLAAYQGCLYEPGIFLGYWESGPSYFYWKIEEKWNQKKSLAVWFPAYLLYLHGNLKS